MSRVVKIDSYTKTGVKRTRVAAYARVSTDNVEQLASLDAQKQYYTSYIKSNKDWEYVGLFYDEGVSGTKTDKREGLLQMLDECRKGNIDFIIVKSISRLARNTVDCLKIVRELYDLGIYIFFEKENINTSKMESELLLTILSSIAESESRSISKNVKWSTQKRFEQGRYIIVSPPYGYKNKDGEMIVVPEESEIVKMIFQDYLSGNGTQRIANTLNAKGIKPRRSKAWSSSSVNGILHNEKYTGDAIFQKTFTDDQFNRHKNFGDQAKYLVENHHEPIISHEDFNKAQELMIHHRSSKGIQQDSNKYQNRYAFSGKIICGNCGTTWKRRTHYTKSQGEYYTYVCESHIRDITSCDIKYIREKDIEASFCNMMNRLIAGYDIVLKPLLIEMKKPSSKEPSNRLHDIEQALDDCVNQRSQLMNLFMKQYLDSETYNDEISVITQKEEELNFEKDTIIKTQGVSDAIKRALEEIAHYASRKEYLTEFSEDYFNRFVDHIVVNNRNQLIFCLRCGLKLKERV